jgi:chromosome segregation ATPase
MGPSIFSEVNIRVEGDPSHGTIKDDIFIVKGDPSDKKTSGLMRVQSALMKNSDKLNAEDKKAWELTRLNIVKNVQNKLASIDLKDESFNFDKIENELQGIIETEIGINQSSSSDVTKNVLDDVLTTDLKENVQIGGEISGSIDSILAERDKFKKESDKKEKKINKMKKLIDTMKVKMVKMQAAELSKPPETSTIVNSAEIVESQNFTGGERNETESYLKGEVDKLKMVVSSKDKEIERLKYAAAQRENKKDEYVSNLEKEVKELKAQIGPGVNNIGGEGENLTLENEELARENDRLRKRINEMSIAQEEGDGSDSDFHKTYIDKLEKELVKLQTDRATLENKVSVLEGSQSSMAKKLKSSNAELYKTESVPKESDAKKDEKKELKKTIQEKDLVITKTTMDLKNSQDQVGKLTHQIKVLENKLKMTQAQVSSPTNSNDRRAKGGGDPRVAQLSHKVKQLEKVGQKTAAMHKKAVADLAEKKKEVQKYKQETTILKNKMAELERKLGIKKAG